MNLYEFTVNDIHGNPVSLRDYQGRVLLIHAQQTSKGIAWRRNLGVLGVARGLAEVTVKPRANVRFAVKHPVVKPAGAQSTASGLEADVTRTN